MSTIYVEPAQQAKETLFLVQSAIESEIIRLELAIRAARKRLAPFEKKYRVPSEYFIANMVAEDLTDGDDEYVRWAGEYELMKRLEDKLQRLKGISCSD